MTERVISERAYCGAIALAYLAAPDGSDDERALDEALRCACERARLTTIEVLDAVSDEHGALYVEGAWDAPECDGDSAPIERGAA